MKLNNILKKKDLNVLIEQNPRNMKGFKYLIKLLGPEFGGTDNAGYVFL